MSAQQSSLNDVFRFIALRSPEKLSHQPKLMKTAMAHQFETTPTFSERRNMANKLLGSNHKEVIYTIDNTKIGKKIYDLLIEVLENKEATLSAVIEKIPDLNQMIVSKSWESEMIKISDTLLVRFYSSKSFGVPVRTLKKVYIIIYFLKESLTEEALKNYKIYDLFKRGLLPPVSSEDNGDSEDPGGSKNFKITAVGVADLLVVKQHISRYEASEVAHIENIMSGETRTREHRSLERIEETLKVEKEKISEKEKELETSERFELNKEASRTIKEDQKYAFDLSVSANYGPTVQVETGFNLDIATSSESTYKSASKYAKDVIERSLERVKERVTEERIKTILRETEEKNLHSFVNGDDRPNKAGVYQFVDKIYRAQVFNYGKRQMLDLMIPEPASYLWHLNKQTDISGRNSVPQPPEALTISATDIRYLGTDAAAPNFYTKLGQKYGALGLTPPPDKTVIVTQKFQNPNSGTAPSSEEGNLLSSPVVLEFSIPDGYVPIRGQFHCTAFADDPNTAVPFFVGDVKFKWQGDIVLSHGRNLIRQGTHDFTFANTGVYSAGNKLIMTAIPYETGNYSISVQVVCEASRNHMMKWKLETYDKIKNAYNDRVLEHKDEVAKLKLELKQQESKLTPDFGLPPSQRKQIIITELKKQCIAMFMKRWFDNTATDFSRETYEFNFSDAIAKGNVIKFLEQAIEWSQLQFALYPYFWAHKDSWQERISKDDADYEFQQFMQAGSARVVLAIRPKFEEAFNYYLETGLVWNGEGESPVIHDPLYVSIVEELRELTGGTLDKPVAVGSPWEIKVPTNLVIINESPELPAWKLENEDDWTWTPEV